MIEKGELATSIKKKVKNKIHLFGQCWEWQTTSLIAFIFGVLVNVGKKIVCLQCGLKVDASRKTLTVDMTSYYEMFPRVKNTVVCRSQVDEICFYLFF